jgi:ABC-2 type transport system permease protein
MSRWRSIRLVAMREILERGRSRGYLGSLVFTLILLGVGFAIPVLVFGQPQAIRIGIIGDPPPTFELTLRTAALNYERELEITRLPDREAADAALLDEAIDLAVDVPAELSSPGEIVVRDRATEPGRTIVTAAVISLRAGTAIVPPEVVALDPPAEADVTALLFANAGIILMFVGIFSYGTWVLSGVVEEKQSRVVEVVLSTVRARDLLMGKVLGIGVLALGQLLVIVSFGLAATQLTGRFVLPDATPQLILQFLAWFILGFALYSTALGFLGSLASRMEEATNATLPVTTIAMMSYFIGLLFVTDQPRSLVAQIMTFLPPSAVMVVPLRAALDAIAPWEIVLSAGLTIAAIFALFVVGGRVYSGAVLHTGGRIRLRDAWRAADRG